MIAQIGWGMYRKPIAKKQAMDFCAAIKIGQPTEGILEQAIASGAVKAFAKWFDLKDGTRSMSVIYVGMPPFARHICLIKAEFTVLNAE